MVFWRSREKPFKMIWRVTRGDRISYLAGTAHFFPYRFGVSLADRLKTTDTVLFEGPLDKESMARVSRAGTGAGEGDPLEELLDAKGMARLRSVLFPEGSGTSSGSLQQLLGPSSRDPLRDLVRGMKPWMAFFTLWTSYLERKGWRYSVDLQAYEVAKAMKKQIVFLERIEEQIEVLESLSLDRIRDFFSRADQWDKYIKSYVKGYLEGDLDGILSLSIGFPSRTPMVIERRDEILFQRMLPYVERGNAAAFVGTPHVRGIRPMLVREGYTVEHAGS
ncbi:MAG: TraB/GumN family protein [Thermodesulfobacteriota bacterium]